MIYFGSVPTTPDPNTSAEVSRCKWEAYRDTNWCRIYTTFCQEKGILLQKYRDRNGRCIAILFKSIGVRGRCDSPDSYRDPVSWTSYFLGDHRHLSSQKRVHIVANMGGTVKTLRRSNSLSRSVLLLLCPWEKLLCVSGGC